MNLRKKWIRHLKQNNMSYYEHMLFAMFYGYLCIIAGLYLIVHSLLPCFFETAGSDLVSKLNERFKKSEQTDDT